jgi:hypothetical protein
VEEARGDAGLSRAAVFASVMVCAGICAAVVGARVTPRGGLRVSDDNLLRGTGVSGPVQQAEAHIAVDPGNRLHMLGGAQEGRLPTGAARASGFYVSEDGGATWDRGLLPGLTQAVGGSHVRVSDPVVALGTGDRAYYANLGLDFGKGPSFPSSSAILVSRSADGGHTWLPPVVVARGSGNHFLDKEWLAANESTGALYVAWTDSRLGGRATQRILLSRSKDGGATWSRPLRLSGSDRSAAAPIVLAGPGGEATVAYLHFSGADRTTLRVVRSSDGGVTWSGPVRVASYRGGSVLGIRADAGLAGAVRPGTGRLELAWQADGRGFDTSDLFTSRSLNGGRTWSRPRRLKAGSGPQFTPSLAAKDGVVHLLFYEGTGGNNPQRFRVAYALSRNGGGRFGRPKPVSPAFSPRNAVLSDRGAFWGDYAGLAATSAGHAQALWVDSRNAPRRTGAKGGNDVYTASVP